MNSEKIKKTLRIAVNVGCGFEGDAEDAAELLTLITGLESRIAALKGVIEILEDQQREVKNILIDKNLHIDSLYEEGYKLQQRIAELEEAQRWIPVSERLPEVGKVVHVIDMNDTGGHLCNLYETAMLVEVSGNKRFGFIGHSGWDSSDVTHWMPLPKLPEVEE